MDPKGSEALSRTLTILKRSTLRAKYGFPVYWKGSVFTDTISDTRFHELFLNIVKR